MTTFAHVADEAARNGLPFLLIGGHAVAHHHYSRTTEDTDILVSVDHREAWLNLAGRLGLKVFHDGGTFLQLTPGGSGVWRLDLMLVNATTFAKMVAAAVSGKLEGQTVQVVALDHLLALKFHALKHTRGTRGLKDMDDVVNLVLNNRVDVKAPAFRELVLKYGTAELYERLSSLCAE
jgi:predicted nucleotidyltransferase